eukprot:scaffold900_cov399-Pavlova_lutheri.AAC.20
MPPQHQQEFRSKVMQGVLAYLRVDESGAKVAFAPMEEVHHWNYSRLNGITGCEVGYEQKFCQCDKKVNS